MTEYLSDIKNNMLELRTRCDQLSLNEWDGALSGKNIDSKNYSRALMNLVKSSPQLMACNPKSIIDECLQIATLGLRPEKHLGQAYLIPYRAKNQNQSNATLIIGYKGFIDLAFKSGHIKAFYAHVRCKNDKFIMRLGTNKSIDHWIVDDNDRGEMIGVYAVVQYVNGGFDFEYLSKAQVEALQKRSKASSVSWQTDKEEMWKKSAIRRLSKRIPMCPDLQTAVSMDEEREDPERKNVDLKQAFNDMVDDTITYEEALETEKIMPGSPVLIKPKGLQEIVEWLEANRDELAMEAGILPSQSTEIPEFYCNDIIHDEVSEEELRQFENKKEYFKYVVGKLKMTWRKNNEPG